jgi:hypothetical protein
LPQEEAAAPRGGVESTPLTIITSPPSSKQQRDNARRRTACTSLEVDLFDVYGDGWSGVVLHVGPFTFALAVGAVTDATTVCLDDGVYYPYACGGDGFWSEVTWTVGTVSGGADESCVPSAGSLVVAGPTRLPTPRPSVKPTPRPSLWPTSQPTLAVSCSAKTCTEHGATWTTKMLTYGSPTVCAYSKVSGWRRLVALCCGSPLV